MNINKVTKNSVIITDTAVPIAKYSGTNVNKRIKLDDSNLKT